MDSIKKVGFTTAETQGKQAVPNTGVRAEETREVSGDTFTKSSKEAGSLSSPGKTMHTATAAPARGGADSQRAPQKYLNIFWNQHQPYYKDEVNDCFTTPWVRLHSTKDYYDMAAVLDNYPNVHATINLSSSLLRQVVDYTDKLHDFADVKSPNYGKISAYPEGHVDRYMDLLVKPVDKWSVEDKQFARDRFFDADYKGQIEQQAGYKYLYDKRAKGLEYTDQDFRDLKVWFNLAWMDHMFLEKPVELIGDKIDGTPMDKEYVEDTAAVMRKGYLGGYGNSGFTEQDAIRLAMDQYKIMKFVIPVHRHMQNKIAPDGNPQVEVVTTPFYHPILPLVNNLGKAGAEANPGMSQPADKIAAPEDADAQVAKGAELYKSLFGHYPKGMWPGEGSVSEDVIKAFQNNGIKWIASGNEVAMKSGNHGDTGLLYRVDKDSKYLDKDGAGGATDNTDAMSMVFRSMHDRVGFDYGGLYGRKDGADAAWDFIDRAKAWSHSNGVPDSEDCLITNMADGENCWQNYTNDGHDFLEALYGALNDESCGIKTTTPSAYTKDHPIDKQWELEPLASGSWVGGDFSTWLGETAENDAWARLNETRDALVEAKVPQPPSRSECPDPAKDRKGYFVWKAWESIYAAEGSDWFWWYGNDQGDNSTSDAKFSETQRTHLVNSYVFAQKAGFDVEYPAKAKLPLDASNVEIQVPPVTRNPNAEPPVITPDGKKKTVLSIDAFMDKKDPGGIAGLTVDLRPLGGAEKVPMVKDEKTVKYVVKASAAPGTEVGEKLLKITAVSTTGAKSTDFINVIVDKELTMGDSEIPSYIAK
ncbi:MAG: glycoside hydrolase family 57 protein [Chloroflexi bacterium]|nr:glycoside hydrolase family 57 protein [Chloroflexota bacterium]